MQENLKDKLVEAITTAENHLMWEHPYTTDTFRIENVADRLIADGWTKPVVNVGDTVYEIALKRDCSGLGVFEREVSKIEITKDGVFLYHQEWREHERIGVYRLTREEAEFAIGESEE